MYLVTGGAGFIGSHLAAALLSRGQSVRVMDNFLTGKRENLAPFLKDIDLFEGDIRDPEACRKAVRGVRHVHHQAALPSVPRSVEDPRTTNDINVTGTLNMLLAARDAGVESFVFASSSSVYGDDPGLPKKEGREGAPLSPYAASKLAGEVYGRIFHDLYGFRAVSLRYFNVFGPRQDPFSQYAAVIPLFITRMLEGRAPIIYGDGEQSRDFTYVADIVEANILAASAEPAGGAVMNVACGRRTTVNHLAEILARELGAEVRAVHADPRPGDILHSYADIERAGRLIGFKPSVPLEDGLAATAAWFRKDKNP
ncbi:MAG: SDR family oxidoreductase [Acidobacteriota bacterium]|nr:SDR family oxidoreductase [Acidobacteriota bacterium]